MAKIEEIFSNFQTDIENEGILKEKIWAAVREVCQAERKMLKHIQIIHTSNDPKIISEVIQTCKELLENEVRPGFAKVDSILSPTVIPPYYQFHDQWRSVSQKLSFLVALIHFLEEGNCALYEDVAVALNMKPGERKGLSLDLEDYLVGLLFLASELSRLAINSVTLGDYNRPLQISKFIAELSTGFRLLTFKNDFLRKRYDVLKYDVKKVEEVVYELSLRGLTTPAKA